MMQFFCALTLWCWVCSSWCFEEDSTAVMFRSKHSKKKALDRFFLYKAFSVLYAITI
jgi:hypothetical protein